MAEKIEVEITGKDELSGVLSDISGALTNIATTAAGFILANVIEGAFNALKEFGTEAIMDASRVQELGLAVNTVAESFGISKDVANQAVANFENLGISIQGSQNAVIQFMRSNLDLAKSEDIVRVAQGAAILSGQDSSETLTQIIYGIQTMNTRILRTQGIYIDTSKAIDDYAKSLGTTSAALTEDQKQQAVMNAVIANGQPLLDLYTQAMTTFGKQLRSLTGREIPDMLATMGAPFQDAFAGGIHSVREFVDSLKNAVAEGGPLHPILMELAQALGILFGSGEKFVNGISWQTVADALKPVADMFLYISQVISTMAGTGNPFDALLVGLNALGMTGLSQFIQHIQYLFALLTTPGQQGNFLTALGISPDIVQGITQAVQKIIPFLQWLGDNAPKYLALLGSAFTSMWQTIQPTLQEFWNTISTNFPQISAVIGELIPVSQAVLIFLGSAVVVIIGIVTGIVNGIIQASGTMQLAITNVVQGIVGLFTGIVNVVAGVLGLLFGTIVGIVTGNWSIVKNSFDLLVNGIMQIIGGIGQFIVGVFMQTFGTAISFVSGFVTGVIGFFTNLYNILVGHSIIPDLLNEIYALFTNILTNTVGLVGSKIDEIIQAFKDRVKDFIQMGEDLINGVVTGILNAAGGLLQQVRKTIQDSINAAKRAAGIQSPSTVFAEIGNQLMAGMAQGIVGGVSMPINAIVGTVPALAGAALSSPVASGRGSGSLVINVTINTPLNTASESQMRDVLNKAIVPALRRAQADGVL